ncbi:unnamed protein product, partial [Prorocentrum cordatum]
MAVVYHLAERLGAPWVCASPALVPYAAPPDFEKHFKIRTDFPELHAAILAGSMPGWTWHRASSVAHIGSWLWPLFTDNHALFRENLLGLPPVPGYDEADSLLPQIACARGASCSGCPARCSASRRAGLAPARGRRVRGVGAGGGRRPAPGAAGRVPGRLRGPGPRGALLRGLRQHGEGGLGQDPGAVLKVVVDTARWMKLGVVVMVHMVEGLSAQCQRETPAGDFALQPGEGDWPGALLCYTDVCHCSLLPECSAAVHHGGIGTTIAALRAGIPQLIVPIAFDQPYWAERVGALGVGDSLQMDELTVPVLSRALRRLLSADVEEETTLCLCSCSSCDGARAAASRLGAQIRAADGVGAAVSAILSAAEGAAPPRAHCASPLRPARRVALHPGDGAPRVWARCPGEVQYVHSEIASRACYGDVGRLQPGCVVIDAGMNLGLFALHLARTWTRGSGAGAGASGGGGASVAGVTCLGFEPCAETYDLALRNLREQGVQVVDHGVSLAGLSPSVLPRAAQEPAASEGLEHSGLQHTVPCVVVHCFNLALSDKDEELELCVLPHLSSNSTLKRHRAAKERHRHSGAYEQRLVEFFFAEERVEKVQAVSLASVLRRLLGAALPGAVADPIAHVGAVGLLKVDVEGAEAEVLAGLGEEHWRLISRIAMEVHTREALEAVQTLLSKFFSGEVKVEEQDDLDDHWMLYACARSLPECSEFSQPGAGTKRRRFMPDPAEDKCASPISHIIQQEGQTLTGQVETHHQQCCGRSQHWSACGGRRPGEHAWNQAKDT